MKKYILIIIALLMLPIESASVFADAAHKVEAQSFFESLGDVPLMSGLYEMQDESIVFDKPGGRIIEAAGISEDVSGAELRAFYNQVLPQMGWLKSGKNEFVRQNEKLLMSIESRDDFSVIRFMLSPR